MVQNLPPGTFQMILSYCKLGKEELYTETHPRNRYFQAALDSCRLFRDNTVLPSPTYSPSPSVAGQNNYVHKISPTHEDKGTENIYYVGGVVGRAPPPLVQINLVR